MSLVAGENCCVTVVDATGAPVDLAPGTKIILAAGTAIDHSSETVVTATIRPA